MENRSKLQYAFYEVPDPVLNILANSKTTRMLHLLNFDISKYMMRSYDFFLRDFSSFIYQLNRENDIIKDQDSLKNIDLTVFCEPWLVNFLEKVLEKKNNNHKVV